MDLSRPGCARTCRYWTVQWNQPYSGSFIPQIDIYKWLEPRHMTQLTSRWLGNHTDDIQVSAYTEVRSR